MFNKLYYRNDSKVKSRENHETLKSNAKKEKLIFSASCPATEHGAEIWQH